MICCLAYKNKQIIKIIHTVKKMVKVLVVKSIAFCFYHFNYFFKTILMQSELNSVEIFINFSILQLIHVLTCEHFWSLTIDSEFKFLPQIFYFILFRINWGPWHNIIFFITTREGIIMQVGISAFSTKVGFQLKV